jgi:AraC family transcriptional activator of pyochelin receptor
MTQRADTPIDFVYYEPPLPVDTLRSTELVEEAVSIPLEYGTLELRQWCFDGLCISLKKMHYHDHFLFEKVNVRDVVGLQFNLKGTHDIYQTGNIYHVRSRQHNIVYSPGYNNTFRNGDLLTETFHVEFAPDVFLGIISDSNETLKRFADTMDSGRPVVLAQPSLLLDPDLHRAIADVLHCRYTGGLKKMYLLSKSIEILVMQAEAYDRRAHGEILYCKSAGDRERIEYARDYLIRNADAPPSLSELSRVVGINEYKLKRGFKEVFKTTVFGYLANHRLDNARQVLLESRKTISEIAYETGYSSPQHFSTAFRKKFGVSPREARKV